MISIAVMIALASAGNDAQRSQTSPLLPAAPTRPVAPPQPRPQALVTRAQRVPRAKRFQLKTAPMPWLSAAPNLATGMVGWTTLTKGATKGGATIARSPSGEAHIVVRGADDGLYMGPLNVANPGSAIDQATWTALGPAPKYDPDCKPTSLSSGVSASSCAMRVSTSYDKYVALSLFYDSTGSGGGGTLLSFADKEKSGALTLVSRTEEHKDLPTKPDGWIGIDTFDFGVLDFEGSAIFSRTVRIRTLEAQGCGTGCLGAALPVVAPVVTIVTASDDAGVEPETPSPPPTPAAPNPLLEGVPPGGLWQDSGWVKIAGAFTTPARCAADMCVALQGDTATWFDTGSFKTGAASPAIPGGGSANPPGYARLSTGASVMLVRGTNGHAYSTILTGGQWSAWKDEGGTLQPGSGLSCTADGAQALCLVQATDGRLYWKRISGQ